jgi:hypothetical protein
MRALKSAAVLLFSQIWIFIKMHLKKYLIALFVYVFVLVGCGNGTGNSATEASETEDASGPITILDTFNVNDASAATFFSKSSLSGTQSASMFELASPATITSIKWVGSTHNAGDLDRTTFTIRVFEGNSLPTETPIQERTEVVNMEFVRKTAKGGIYIFTYEDDSMFNISSGRYWLSLVHSEVDGIEFYWEVEPGKAGGSVGAGGAYRNPETDLDWTSNGSGVSAVEARGKNVEILGEFN